MLRILFSQCRIFLQQQIVHREFWVQVFVEVVLPVTIPLLVWLALLGDAGSIGGFTQISMRRYYLLVTVIAVLAHTVIHVELSRLIHEGTLSQWLIRPGSFWMYCVSLLVSRIIVLLFPAIFIVVFMIVLDFNIFAGLGLSHIIAAIVLLPLAVAIACAMNVLIGFTAFWFIEIEGIYAGVLLALGFFGGMIVPLSILPPVVDFIGHFLPHFFVFSGPIETILHPTVSGIFIVLGGQTLWFTLIFLALYSLWPLGLRRFDAVGG